VDKLVPGATHRVSEVGVEPGGKGLNVARVLTALGEPVLATGLLGGTTGDRIAALLAAGGVTARFVALATESRRTVVVTGTGEPTGFWEPGPLVAPHEWAEFLDCYRDCLATAEVVVLAGSLPSGLDADAYATLVRLAHAAGVPSVLDADGTALRAGLRALPCVVKPNAAELAGICPWTTGGPVPLAEMWGRVRALRAGTSMTVVATLGADGLVASTVDGDFHVRCPAVIGGNPTGAGDACVAALAAGLRTGRTWPDMLADAAACGAAAAAEPRAGVVDPSRVRAMRADVVTEVA
jgi:tagatose 6-phosphate kinase